MDWLNEIEFSNWMMIWLFLLLIVLYVIAGYKQENTDV